MKAKELINCIFNNNFKDEKDYIQLSKAVNYKFCIKQDVYFCSYYFDNKWELYKYENNLCQYFCFLKQKFVNNSDVEDVYNDLFSCLDIIDKLKLSV